VTSTRIAAAGLRRLHSTRCERVDRYDFAWSLALLGAGHLVGLSRWNGDSVGQVISWVIAVRG